MAADVRVVANSGRMVRPVRSLWPGFSPGDVSARARRLMSTLRQPRLADAEARGAEERGFAALAAGIENGCCTCRGRMRGLDDWPSGRASRAGTSSLDCGRRLAFRAPARAAV